MSNNSTDTNTDCTFSNITVVIIVITVISMVCLGLEFTKQQLTDGIVISVSILLTTFIYFFILLLQNLLFNKNKNQFNLPYILFIITFIIIIVLLIIFIVLFPNSVIKKINKSQLFNTDTDLYNIVYGFMSILTMYIIISQVIYSYIMCSKENSYINLFIFFAVSFSICEIFVLLRLNNTLNSITDG
jgi:hypothetical protein